VKILLVAPPQHAIVSPTPMKRIQEGLGFLPPLGLLGIATYLRERTRHDAVVLDAHTAGLVSADLEAVVARIRPDAVGITALTSTLLDVVATAAAVKRADASVPVIVGGPHVALFPRETVQLPNVDFAVLGEGEEPLGALLDRLEEAGRRRGLPWRHPEGTPRDGGCVDDLPAVMDRATATRKRRHFHADLETLPAPRRDLVPWQRYRTVVSRRPPTTVLMTSRGCSHSCSFCYTAGGKKVRERAPASVVAEMQQAVRLGIREFFFFDEAFTENPERVHALCTAIERARLDVSWDVRARVDSVDADMLRHMRRAGCTRVQFGIEAGTQRVIDVFQKGITLEQARAALHLARAAGLATYADFMIGGPDETLEEIVETVRFALEVAPDYVHFQVTMPLPGTPLHAQAVRRGILAADTWQRFAAHPTSDFEIPYWTERFSRTELDALLSWCLHRCYMNPRYLLRSLLRVRSMGELMRKARWL